MPQKWYTLLERCHLSETTRKICRSNAESECVIMTSRMQWLVSGECEKSLTTGNGYVARVVILKKCHILRYRT